LEALIGFTTPVFFFEVFSAAFFSNKVFSTGVFSVSKLRSKLTQIRALGHAQLLYTVLYYGCGFDFVFV
jgi:hypothetical protein